MLQFITNTKSAVPVTDQIREVIAGGGRWIQIRMKEASDNEIKDVVEKVMPICLEKEAFLILNDRAELAKELNVGGVHIGKNDMPPSKARVLLGAAAVIGVTANTTADINAVRYLDIDYIGLGPYRFTETKDNLAPRLGTEGLRNLTTMMRENEIVIPTVAVGGITAGDVETVMETGVSGIAVSGAIANAKDIAAETNRFLTLLSNFNK